MYLWKPEPDSSQQSFSFKPGLAVIALDSIGFLVTLAITIYAWHSVHVFSGDNNKSKLGDGPFTNANEEGYGHWDRERTFDPINWNCLIYGFIRDQAREINAPVGRELRREVQHACNIGWGFQRCNICIEHKRTGFPLVQVLR